MTFVTRRYRFSASHRLHSPELSDSENARLYGKCNNPFGHGHDYVLSITVGGQPDPRTGLIIRRDALDKLAGEKVVSAFASKNFNADLPEFAKLVPTTENLARLITERLQSFWPECIGDRVRLVRVHVQETDRNGFEILIGAPDSNECAKEKDENVVNA